MNTKLGFVKLTALAALCAVGLGMTQFAHADSFSIGYRGGSHHNHSRYSVSIGLGSGYYGGGYYYAPRYYAPPPVYYYPPAPYYDDYYYDDYYPSYGYYDSYPSYSISYSNYGRGYYDRDDYYRHRDYNRGSRDHDRDHDGDRHHHR